MSRSLIRVSHTHTHTGKFLMTTAGNIIGTHYLLVNPSLAGNHPVSLIRPLAQQMFMRPWMSFSATSLSFTNWKNNFRTEVTHNSEHFEFRQSDRESWNLFDAVLLEIRIEGTVAGQRPHPNARTVAWWHSSFTLGARLRYRRTLDFVRARYSHLGCECRAR
jgi:hypothetical protein